MKKYLYFFLLAILYTTSCDQTGLAMLHGTKNLVTSPYDGIQRRISANRYDDIVERSNGQREVGLVERRRICHDVYGPLMVENNIELLSEAIRDTACTCQAWGSCDDSVCKCDELCPNNFSIFNKPPILSSTADLSLDENSLSFRNVGAMNLSNHRGTQGYCWGHAAITAQFNRLAFFDSSDNTMKENLDKEPGSLEREQALEYYKNAIDQIVDNEAQKISGFSNLQELSDHPDLQSYMADKVATTWARKATTFQGMGSVIGFWGRMKRDDSSHLINDVVERLNNGQQPQILFNHSKRRHQGHVVLVSHYLREGGQTILCARDNNSPPAFNRSCDNRIYLAEDGGLNYETPFPNEDGDEFWGELGQVKIAHNEDSDTLAQFESLKRYCHATFSCSE